MSLEDGSALAREQGSTTKLTMASRSRTDEKACFAEAIASSRLRCKERLVACVKALPEVVNQQDGEGTETLLDPSMRYSESRACCYLESKSYSARAQRSKLVGGNFQSSRIRAADFHEGTLAGDIHSIKFLRTVSSFSF